MEGDLRSRILHLVERFPGLHLRDIQRRSECSPMLAEYHLNVLERLELITSTHEGRYRHFFPKRHEAMSLDRTDRRWLAMLRRPPVLAMVLALLEDGDVRPMALAKTLDLASSTASYQIRVAKKAGLLMTVSVDGVDRIRVADRARIVELLQAYHPTPDLMTDYAALWSRVFDGARSEPEPAAAPKPPAVPEALVGMPRAVHGVYIALRKGPMTQKELRQVTGHARRTVYGALRRLEDLGLITVHPDLRDTRQSRYVLTDENGTETPENKP